MSAKSKKNLMIPEWIESLLQFEADRYGGQGTIAAASIYAFSRLKDRKKKEVMKQFRDEEINRAYESSKALDDENAAAQHAAARRRSSRQHPA